MNYVNLRSLFSDYNFPKEEIPQKTVSSHKDNLRIAASSLAEFADFHEVIEKLNQIQEEEKIKNDPVLNLLDKIKKFNSSSS